MHFSCLISGVVLCQPYSLVKTDSGLCVVVGSFLVCQAAGVHPVPSRTRQLSPPAPMVLGWSRPGRLGPRQVPFLRFRHPPHCRFRFLPIARQLIREMLRQPERKKEHER